MKDLTEYFICPTCGHKILPDDMALMYPDPSKFTCWSCRATKLSDFIPPSYESSDVTEAQEVLDYEN